MKNIFEPKEVKGKKIETCRKFMFVISTDIVTSHLASQASLKNPSEIECLAADSDSLIWFSQYEEEDRRLNFIRPGVLELSDAGV